jgi:hypothetical protein
VGLQVSVRESRDAAILDLQGKLTTGKDGELLSKQIARLDRHACCSTNPHFAILANLGNSW